MSFYKTSVAVNPPTEVKPCLTPDALYHTHIGPTSVSCKVRLPMPLNLNEEQAKVLEGRIQAAMQAVLAGLFTNAKGPSCGASDLTDELPTVVEES